MTPDPIPLSDAEFAQAVLLPLSFRLHYGWAVSYLPTSKPVRRQHDPH